MSGRGEQLREILLSAVIETARRHPGRRGPYRFDEGELQLLATQARHLLAAEQTKHTATGISQ